MYIGCFLRAGYSPEDVKLLLEKGVTNPKAKGANPQDFIDERPVREVVRSGFIDQLYRK